MDEGVEGGASPREVKPAFPERYRRSGAVFIAEPNVKMLSMPSYSSG